MNELKGKYAWTATVGEKGQIVIPKQAREIFGIKPGDTLLLLGNVNRGIAIPAKGPLKTCSLSLFRKGRIPREKSRRILYSCPWTYKPHAARCPGTCIPGR